MVDYFTDLSIDETIYDYYDTDYYGIGRPQSEIDAEYEEFLDAILPDRDMN